MAHGPELLHALAFCMGAAAGGRGLSDIDRVLFGVT